MKKLPKSLPKAEFIESIVVHESIVFPDQKNTLPRFFKRNLARAWDIEKLSDDEVLTVIKDMRRNKMTAAGLILELKLGTTKARSRSHLR